jgi:hypothetical protein
MHRADTTHIRTILAPGIVRSDISAQDSVEELPHEMALDVALSTPLSIGVPAKVGHGSRGGRDAM